MRKAFVLLLFALSVLSRADAAELKAFRIGIWQAGAYSESLDRKFSYCAGSATYNSGIIVTLLLNRAYKWGVGFGYKDWKLRPGTTVPLAYVVDGGEPRRVDGIVVSSQKVLIAFGEDPHRFAEFARGYQLSIFDGDNTVRFNLTDTSRLLPALLKCVAEHVNPPRVADPLGKSRGDFRAEATALAANLLSQAGITGFRMVLPDQTPGLKADAGWQAGDVYGAISVVPEIPAKDIHTAQSSLIGRDAKACRGTFFSGSIEDDAKDGAAVRIFTSCQSTAKNWTVYYLAVPRKAGGIYVILTGTRGPSEKPAKAADASIRQAVFKAVSR